MNPFSDMQRLRWALPLLAFVLVLTGCDDESLMPPEAPDAGERFARYVSMGNSITAGYQSGGINANLQDDSYAVLLAQQLGTEFNIPALSVPGCPPPLTQIFPTTERLGGAAAPPCALRQEPLPEYINNVAVPGAAVIDLLSNLDASSSANPLTTFILGARTQLEAAAEVDPTFVSAWIGNNDVLGAALAGTDALATPVSTFEAQYQQVADSLEAMDTQGGVLIGVVDVTAVPALSAGQAYLVAIPQAKQAGAAPPNFEIANSCAPQSAGGVGDVTLVPFQHGAALLQVATGLFQQLGQNAPTITLDCAQDRSVLATVAAAFGGEANVPPSVLDQISDVAPISLLAAAEIQTLKQRVGAFNAAIEQHAQDLGYIYVDPNPLLAQYANQIPLFPELIDNPQTPWGPDQPFGPLFSLDGVHPSAQTHVVVANALIDAINAEYGTSVQPIAD